jgi:Spy/CpxP family protein refolding chaperone
METTRMNLLGRSVGTVGALSLALGLLTVPPTDAQEREWARPTPEQMVEEHLTRMTEELELTDEQAAQVRPIIEELLAKRRGLMEKHRQRGRRPGGSGREEMEGLRKEMENRLGTVLTEEQMQRYRDGEQERRERRREAAGRRGRGPRW